MRRTPLHRAIPRMLVAFSAVFVVVAGEPAHGGTRCDTHEVTEDAGLARNESPISTEGRNSTGSEPNTRSSGGSARRSPVDRDNSGGGGVNVIKIVCACFFAFCICVSVLYSIIERITSWFETGHFWQSGDGRFLKGIFTLVAILASISAIGYTLESNLPGIGKVIICVIAFVAWITILGIAEQNEGGGGFFSYGGCGGDADGGDGDGGCGGGCGGCGDFGGWF
jgi:hypothetical protein